MLRYVLAIAFAFSAITYAAIELTAPEVKPEVRATVARITEIRLGFYRGDGKYMLSTTGSDGAMVSCADGYIEYQIGNGDGPSFVATETRFVKLDATELAQIIYASKAAKPTENLVPEVGETPVDKLFQSIVQWLKANGKL